MKPNRAPNKRNNYNKKILVQEPCPLGNITQKYEALGVWKGRGQLLLQQFLGDPQQKMIIMKNFVLLHGSG